jgi:hypothetical protein
LNHTLAIHDSLPKQSCLLIGGGGANLFHWLVVEEQSAKIHAISTTCTTLSHILNLRSKVIFFLVELMECLDTGRAKRSNGTCWFAWWALWPLNPVFQKRADKPFRTRGTDVAFGI